MESLLLQSQTLLRNFALQVVTRIFAHTLARGLNFLAQKELADKDLTVQVLAIVPFVAASILVETAFSYLQKAWNKLQISIALQLPSGATKDDLRAVVRTELQEGANARF